MVAIVLQAFKDMGNDDKGRSVESVLSWTETVGFSTMCNLIDLDPTQVKEMLEDLASYDLQVRRAFLKEIIGSVKSPR